MYISKLPVTTKTFIIETLLYYIRVESVDLKTAKSNNTITLKENNNTSSRRVKCV